MLTKRERAGGTAPTVDPLWVVLGDSTAQGLGAPGPRGGYVGQTLHQLRRTTGQHWRVLNLSVSGALIRDVLADQIPRLDGERPDLVTCGAGANDILYSAPGKLFGDLRALLAAVPDDTVMLDLPLLSGFWGIVGRMSVPYITRINRVIREVARERSLRVAEVSGTSSRRGPASSPSTTSTRARTATATGPGPWSRPSPRAQPRQPPPSGRSRLEAAWPPHCR